MVILYLYEQNQWFSVETTTLESRIINYMYFSLSCMIDF